KRSIMRQYLISVGVSIFLAFVLFASVIGLLIGQYVIMNLNEDAHLLDSLAWISILRYVSFVVLIYIIIATLYYFGTKESRSYRFFSFGAVITTALFMLTTYLFGIYIENFSTYNELYGSIG